ncbi:MAG: hypothetical protein C5B59_08770 [Bacteroidetes bacterium]|nr:MAG: hypothetical protein C5B59_08770 [Bacteroidota bacterium]
MKLLVAVMTCHRLDYYIDDLTVDFNTPRRCLDQKQRVQTIRETWAQHLNGIDYKFFYGSTLRNGGRVQRSPLPDEVFLPCGDNYTSNPQKMVEICKWARAHGYDYILRADDDTFIYPERLLATNWREHDYSGSSEKDFHPGGCMFLSRRAMQLIISAKITNWADDVWIGSVMQTNKIPMNHIESIHNEWGNGYKVDPEKVSPACSAYHSCVPEVMRVFEQRRKQWTGPTM